MPPPQRKSAPPRLRVGSVTRTNAFQDEWHNEDADWVIPSVRCPAIWMITDFTYSNGATMIMPGEFLASIGLSRRLFLTPLLRSQVRIAPAATRRRRRPATPASTSAPSPCSAAPAHS